VQRFVTNCLVAFHYRMILRSDRPRERPLDSVLMGRGRAHIRSMQASSPVRVPGKSAKSQPNMVAANIELDMGEWNQEP